MISLSLQKPFELNRDEIYAIPHSNIGYFRIKIGWRLYWDFRAYNPHLHDFNHWVVLFGSYKPFGAIVQFEITYKKSYKQYVYLYSAIK